MKYPQKYEKRGILMTYCSNTTVVNSHAYTSTYIHAYTCIKNHNDIIITTREDFFNKIYLSFYCKGLCVRGSWRLNKDCNILTSPAPPDIAMCHSRSSGLLNRGPGGPASLGHVLIPASSHQLVSKLYRGPQGPLLLNGSFLYHILSPTRLISNSIGGPEGPFCWVMAFPTTSCLQLVWSPTRLTFCPHRVI